MDYTTERKNGFVIIRITENLGLHSDISELKSIVSKILGGGEKRIALSFTLQSYLYTQSLSVLVQCLDMVNEKNGEFAAIKPNEDIYDALKAIGITAIVKVYPDEDALGGE